MTEIKPRLSVWKQTLHPEDRRRTLNALQDCLQGTAPLDVECRLRTKSSAYRWFRVRGKVFRDADSGRVRLSGAISDIQCCKERELLLHESEQRFRTLADSAPVLIWMSETDKLLTYFNRSWLDFTGRSLDQELGHGWVEGVHPDDRARCFATYTKAFGKKDEYAIEYRLRRHDGNYRYLLEHGAPRFGHRGEFHGYVGSCIDITERRKAELLFRTAFEQAVNGMIMVNRQGEIVLANETAHEMFGYTRGKLAGQPIETLVPESKRDGHRKQREGFAAHPDSRAMGKGRELEARRKDGTVFPVEVGLKHVDGPAGWMVLVSLIDIAERKAAEQKILETLGQLERANQTARHQAEELRSSNEALEQFAYLVSHDLRQPLRNLINFSTLLREDAGKELSPQAVEDLEFITKTVGSMQHLVQGLFDLCNARNWEMDTQLVALDNCVDDALDALRTGLAESGAEVRRQRLPVVMGNRSLIVQIYQNLIENALKFTPDGTPSKVELTAERNGKEWVLGVRDNGIGIAHNYTKTVFEPFVQLNGRKGHEGHGMGLAICRMIAERHGGRIWHESEPGQGTHFKFTLPATENSDLQQTS